VYNYGIDHFTMGQAMRLFTEESLSFLSSLKLNNNREWFEQHKAEYQKWVQKPAVVYLEKLCNCLGEVFGVPFTGKIFRIHRDVRFSKDKTPYNPHIRMMFYGLDETSLLRPTFFLSIEPEKVFFGVGNHQFTSKELPVFRELIMDKEHGEQLEKLIKSSKADGFILNEAELARVPAGYDKLHPRAYLFKHKGFAVWREFASTIEAVSSLELCLAVFIQLRPLFKLLKNYTSKD